MQAEDLLLGFRFGVTFMLRGKGTQNIEARFQKVSGLGASLRIENVKEGGENLSAHRMPTEVSFDNLVLERGRLATSRMDIDFAAAMTMSSFTPCTVMLTMLDEHKAPAAAWMFLNAYPVRWRLSDLDATRTEVAIETLELTYSRMQIVEC